MTTLARIAAAGSGLAAFLTACDLATRAPWYDPVLAAATAILLAAVSAWIRRTTNPNTDDKDTP